MSFTGTVVISQNPVTGWERYSRTLGISVDKGVVGYRNLRVEERAESGYYRCRFRLYGPREFLSEFLVDGLSRQVEVFHPDGRKKWEGLVYEMKLETGTATMRTSLDNLSNKVWARYRITGAGVTSRSTVQEDAASQTRYGIKEFILGCGELEAADVANQVATQYLRLHKNPTPAPTAIKIGKGIIDEAFIEVEGRGFFETLLWRVWNNTGAAANQGASAQIADIIGERESVEIGYPAVWDQTFDEQIADFDAISPTWDKHADFEEGDTSDFDAVQDADGDLNAAMAAAHDGTWGIEITFDNAVQATGRLDALAVDQTSGVLCLWFNPNTVGLDNGAWITLVASFDGVAATAWGLQMYNNGGTYQIRPYHYDDFAAFQAGTLQDIPDAYCHLLIMFNRSTGAGNDDGWLRFYIDADLKQNWTGHDNDTKDWDTFQLGMFWTNSAGFGGSFYMDEIYIDPVGAPMVNTLAARNGTYGLMIPIMDTTARYGEFTGPANETEITIERWIHPNTLEMADGDIFAVMEGLGSGAVATSVRTNLERRAGNYELSLAVYDDSSVLLSAEPIVITGTWHLIRTVLKVATGAGNDDGMAYLFVDNGKVSEIEGIDNDGYDVDSIRCGAVSGLDAGTYGLLYMDDCRWSDDVVITLTSESGVAQFVARSELRTNSTLVSKIYDADRKAGDIVSDIARLGDAGYKRWLVYMTDGRTFVYDQATPAERD